MCKHPHHKGKCRHSSHECHILEEDANGMLIRDAQGNIVPIPFKPKIGNHKSTTKMDKHPLPFPGINATTQLPQVPLLTTMQSVHALPPTTSGHLLMQNGPAHSFGCLCAPTIPVVWYAAHILGLLWISISYSWHGQI